MNPLSLSKIFNPKSGWYRGDFHAHTTFSDGLLTPPQFFEEAKSAGLDFCAITDHNTVDAFPHFGDTGDFLIFPGTEVTLENLGDFNVYGLNPSHEWFQKFVDNKPWDEVERNARGTMPNEILKATSALGLLNSINHPFVEPWQWRDASAELTYIHCLEIWNDPSYLDFPGGNMRAIQLWTDLLNEGYRITAIGGSDFHQLEPDTNKPAERLGLPSTYVYLDNLSGNSIMDALRNHRAWVSMGAKVDFQADANGSIHRIGADLGPVSAAINLTAAVTESPLPAAARLVKNGQVLSEKQITKFPTNLRFTDTLTSTQPAWYRLDVYDGHGQMLAITNPIFTGERIEPTRKRIGEF